ncbi:hypothetical protein, partial [Streptomyces somaliensis]|uniref:hypothetical protein n=1 Tax=Streptomyces somaliensis TaxID=78355 RepID=UPI003704BCAD
MDTFVRGWWARSPSAGRPFRRLVRTAARPPQSYPQNHVGRGETRVQFGQLAQFGRGRGAATAVAVAVIGGLLGAAPGAAAA